MSTDTLIMVVLICVGSALWAIGLGFSGYYMRKVSQAARAAGVTSKADVQVIAGRVQRLGPRVRELETKQRAVAEQLESISTTARDLF